MSIAIVIIVTSFGARSTGEVLRSSGTLRSATELCVLKCRELSSRRRIDVDNNILLLVIPRSLRRVLLTIKTITCHWVERKDQELCFSWSLSCGSEWFWENSYRSCLLYIGLYIILHLVKPKCSFKEITNGFKLNV